MRASFLSKFHPVQWLATVVTAALTWPVALALSIGNELGRVEEGSKANAIRPASKREGVGGNFDYRVLFPRGYGPYRW